MNANVYGQNFDDLTPVENIYFETAPEGDFRFFVRKVAQRSASEYTSFTCRLKIQVGSLSAAQH